MLVGVKAVTEVRVVPAATKVSIAPINFNERTILKISVIFCQGLYVMKEWMDQLDLLSK